MPRLRKVTMDLDDPDRPVSVVDPDDTISFEQYEQAIDLIRWVGRTIVTRNANGRQSDKFCKLCQPSKLHKEPCRHADVWRLARIDK